MPIKFTKHALERLNSRAISKEEVYETLNNPDTILNDSFKNFTLKKFKRINLSEFSIIPKVNQKLFLPYIRLRRLRNILLMSRS